MVHLEVTTVEFVQRAAQRNEEHMALLNLQNAHLAEIASQVAGIKVELAKLVAEIKAISAIVAEQPTVQ